MAENPRKVENIVEAQESLLWGLFEPLLKEVGEGVSESIVRLDKDGAKLSQDRGPRVLYLRYLALPLGLKQVLSPKARMDQAKVTQGIHKFL